ncbi:alpha/beta hydrolase [Aporhodopirellula aestuarii]|uniref:Alpha/beta hydrolase n=1 Tax=Aporhodopirellula aestuarii TaxID=2950107 RepID=A0ABT0UE48_9BACT|nr:alpha/beta hydrolase [Aporhodopirellula aestuarii]MCM2375195.1 alpha/beta hydrolase [Aporhodopirellula aestuarii]
MAPAVLPAQNVAERLINRMKSDDKNGDGKLTQAEFTGPDRLFQQLDEDGDGVLVLAEAAQKLKMLRERIGEIRDLNAGNTDARPQRMVPRQRTPIISGVGRRQVKPDYENVRYSDHERHVFDVYAAKTEGSEPAPCMIWIHGGGFRRGDKSEGSLFSTNFTSNGIHFVTLNYRLSQHAIAPACFDDCARALQFIRLNAEKWNIDKSRIAVGGGSAGAGLAQWIGYNDDRADPSAVDPVARESTRVSALILLNAQTSYDYRWIKTHIPGEAWKGDGLQELFGYQVEKVDDLSEEKHRLIEEYSPINHFTKDDPPSLFYFRRSRDPSIAEKNPMDGIHHPIFGLELKKLADEMNVRCDVFSVESPTDLAFYNRRWDHAIGFLKERFEMK